MKLNIIKKLLDSIKDRKCFVLTDRATGSPINARTGRYAEVNNSDTFATLDECIEALEKYADKCDNIAIVLDEELGIVCIDLDDCINEDGTYNETAEKVLSLLSDKTYVEKSRSGNGLHIFVYGEKNVIKCRSNGIEYYDNKHAITLTGDSIDNVLEISEDQGFLDRIEREYFEDNININSSPHSEDNLSEDEMKLENVEVSNLISKLKNSSLKFEWLFNGGNSNHPSESEADLAFFREMELYGVCDPHIMKEIYFKSKRVREKSQRDDYLDRTINKILSTPSETKKKFHNRKLFIPNKEPKQKQKEGSDLLNQIREINPIFNVDYRDFNIIQMAKLFAEIFKNKVRYNRTDKEYSYYDDVRWLHNGDMRVEQLIIQFIEALSLYLTENMHERDENGHIDSFTEGLIKKKDFISSHSFMVHIFQDARSFYCFSEEDLDKDNNLFNVQNGTLNLQTLELQPHNPDDLLSKVANVKYDPEAKCPIFDDFVHQIMNGDYEKEKYLRMKIGYSMLGTAHDEELYILYGPTTRNGKSTFLESVNNVFGDYSININPETIASKTRDSRQASGDIARLKGVRLVQASEPPKRMIFDIALIKQLTGRDMITARFLYGRDFDFRMTSCIFINTNYLPKVLDETLFSSNRVKVITFDRHFTEKEQDHSLKDRLASEDEMCGILNWCLKGLKEYRECPSYLPNSVTKATDEYKDESDKVANFIADTYDEDDDSVVIGATLYEDFKKWCDDSGMRPESKPSLFKELKAKGYMVESRTLEGKTVRNVMNGYKPKPEVLEMRKNF